MVITLRRDDYYSCDSYFSNDPNDNSSPDFCNAATDSEYPGLGTRFLYEFFLPSSHGKTERHQMRGRSTSYCHGSPGPWPVPVPGGQSAVNAHNKHITTSFRRLDR